MSGSKCCSAFMPMWPRAEEKLSELYCRYCSPHSSSHCFRPHLHNNYLLWKRWPSVETPCQLLSDLRVPFSEGNAGCDSFNWFLSLRAHLSILFPFLTPPCTHCGSMTTQHCEVALLICPQTQPLCWFNGGSPFNSYHTIQPQYLKVNYVIHLPEDT